MKGYIEAAVKLYSGDKPLDLFVQKLPEKRASDGCAFSKRSLPCFAPKAWRIS